MQVFLLGKSIFLHLNHSHLNMSCTYLHFHTRDILMGKLCKYSHSSTYLFHSHKDYFEQVQNLHNRYGNYYQLCTPCSRPHSQDKSKLGLRRMPTCRGSKWQQCRGIANNFDCITGMWMLLHLKIDYQGIDLLLVLLQIQPNMQHWLLEVPWQMQQ